MKITTYLVEGVTAFLVKVLLRPKVYYVEPPKRRGRLDSPSVLIINHTGHLDGPVVSTVFRCFLDSRSRPYYSARQGERSYLS